MERDKERAKGEQKSRKSINPTIMNPKNLRIVYMGTPEFAVAPLKALVEGGYNVVKVITVPDKPQGRGLKLGQSAVKEYALSAGLELLQPEKLKDETFLSTLKSLNADLFIVVAFRMLPAEVWKMPALGTFNLHASLLPRYRGAAPINWAIINGERETGVTTFLIDEKIDTGHILMQRRVAIGECETVGTLYDRLMEVGTELVIETVDSLANGTTTPRSQAEEENNNTPLPEAPKLNRENCTIDWSQPADKIELLVRGLSPYPAALATIQDSNGKETGVKLYMALAEMTGSELPVGEKPANGTIKSNGKTYLSVVCGKGELYIEEMQLAGKKRMKVKELLAGFRNPDSHRFL